MTECQGCGAWNERQRTLCVLCGTPLAETDEWDATADLPPLPPLPDGGLSVTMPAWLRAMPGAPEPVAPGSMAFLATADEDAVSVSPLAASSDEWGDTETATDPGEPPPADATLAEQPLGPQADPRTFLRDEDFPRWIRELPALPPRPVLPTGAANAPAMEPAILVTPSENPLPPSILEADAPAVSQVIAGQALHTVAGAAELAQVPASLPGDPAVPTASTPRRREAWETPLLVVLVVGVVAAVIWALLVNGLIGSGL